MLLKKVSIKNFKSIKNIEFDFPESNILVLVGENNAGKLNIIRAIDVICGESWYGKEKIGRPRFLFMQVHIPVKGDHLFRFKGGHF